MEIYGVNIEIPELLKKPAVTMDDVEYYRQIERRELYLQDDVSIDTVAGLVARIREFNREDLEIPVLDRTPIKLFVFSGGGDVFAGYSLIDTILQSKTPVYTINDGFACSMAGLICLSGHKRFTNKHATIMLHDGSVSMESSAGKAEDFMEFNKRLKEKTRNLVLGHSSITEREYDIKYKDDWYMLPEEALAKGVVDYIIGSDGVSLDALL